MSKEFLGALAIVLTFAAFIPYIRSILTGQTKPHVFSWVIWGTATCIIFLAQLSDGGGAGAWPIGVSGLVTYYVAWLAYLRRADHMITRVDWFFFIAAMSSIPAWYFTADPLWAVVILTLIDTLGFGPTFRKAYWNPFEEQIALYAVISARNVVALAALEHYSLTTVLFPALMTLVCAVLILMILARRRIRIHDKIK